MSKLLPSEIERISLLIREDRYDEVEAAIAHIPDLTWDDWCALCRITVTHFDHQFPSPAQASGSRKTESDR